MDEKNELLEVLESLSQVDSIELKSHSFSLVLGPLETTSLPAKVGARSAFTLPSPDTTRGTILGMLFL